MGDDEVAFVHEVDEGYVDGVFSFGDNVDLEKVVCEKVGRVDKNMDFYFKLKSESSDDFFCGTGVAVYYYFHKVLQGGKT